MRKFLPGLLAAAVLVAGTVFILMPAPRRSVDSTVTVVTEPFELTQLRGTGLWQLKVYYTATNSAGMRVQHGCKIIKVSDAMVAPLLKAVLP